MTDRVPAALTIGEIARRLKCPNHRIEYIVRTKGIRAEARAGNLRIFREKDLERIQEELLKRNRRKES